LELETLNLKLPSIYPITDTRISGLSHAEQVEKLIAGGATLIQLRDKHASPSEFYEAAKAAISIARHHNAKILINDRVDIALALKADGVHLGQDDLPPEKAREILGADAIIGFSTHTLEQVKSALTLPIDYIAFGPVFPTITKEDPDAVVGLDQLKLIRSLIKNKPLVAIGGIDETNVKSVLSSGADSAAVISAVLVRPHSIENKTTQLFNIVKD
jgi:thiamine-phosphate pyrophosphorylase